MSRKSSDKSWTKLTVSQMRNVNRYLTKRFVSNPSYGIEQLGFGVARKKGKLDFERGLSLCFHVKKKKKSRATKFKNVPKTVSVPLRQRGKQSRVRLRTDVKVTGRIIPTSVAIGLASPPNLLRGGCVVVWKENGARKAGLLAIAHSFRFRGMVPGDSALIGGFDGSADISGKIAWIASDPQIDASIVRAEIGDLKQAGIIKPTDDLNHAASSGLPSPHVAGRSFRFPNSTTVSFIYEEFIAVENRIERISPVRDILRVTSSATGKPFAPGTSGSPWVIGSHVAAIQVGARETAFQEGYGQSVASILQAIKSEFRQVTIAKVL